MKLLIFAKIVLNKKMTNRAMENIYKIIELIFQTNLIKINFE